MGAWRAGNVAIANAPGAGVADDKVVYAYVPEIIRYYLGEDPLVASVETYLCLDDVHRSHVLANLDEMVVKPANESGGYGIFIGSFATEADKAEIVAACRGQPPRLHRPADPPAVDRPHPATVAASRRATSTSGRSSCRATSPTSPTVA